MFSYDNITNTYDTNETDGRSYISAVSEVIYDASLDCVGMAKTEMGEARMDIEDTEIGYLGYHDSESYGLTWKVISRNRTYMERGGETKVLMFDRRGTCVMLDCTCGKNSYRAPGCC